MTKKTTLQRAINTLRANSKNAEDLDFIVVLQDILNNENNATDSVNLFDREAYFAAILWQEQDIAAELDGRELDAGAESIAKVLDNLDIDEMENCEHGWECIYQAIDEVEDQLEYVGQTQELPET